MIEYLTGHGAMEQVLRQWLIGNANVAEAQWGDLAISRPAIPFGTLQIINPGILEGQDDEYLEYNDGTERIDVLLVGPRRMTVQAMVYTEPPTVAGANHAANRLMKAVAALRAPSVRDSLKDGGLSFLQVLSPPQRLDEQLGERWEWWAQADLEFLYTSLLGDLSEGAAPNATGGLNWIETNDDTIVTYEE